MRELVLKNLMSQDHKKKEVFLAESYEKEGYLQRLEKQSVYIVEDFKKITENFDLAAYLDQKKHQGLLQPKHTYIVKMHDSKRGEDKFIYKTCGDLYAIVDDKVYVIRLKQSLVLDFIQEKEEAQ